MRLRIKGRHVELSESVRTYAEAKLKKLDKQLAEPTEVELELWEEQNPSIAAHHVAEATIWTKGPTLRAREASTSFEASIDELVDKLERQVKRYREKRSRRETARRNGLPEPEPMPVEELERELRG
jgi:putative sigma-54 modulation protein